MAEGFLKKYGGQEFEVCSAGIEAHGLNPGAVAAMARAGIDISGQQSQTIDEFSEVLFDVVLTVCDHANERCPILPGKHKKFHHNFPDPSKALGSEQEILQKFDATRDLIDDYCRNLIASLR